MVDSLSALQDSPSLPDAALPVLQSLLLIFLVALYEGVDIPMEPCIKVARNSVNRLANGFKPGSLGRHRRFACTCFSTARNFPRFWLLCPCLTSSKTAVAQLTAHTNGLCLREAAFSAEIYAHSQQKVGRGKNTRFRFIIPMQNSIQASRTTTQIRGPALSRALSTSAAQPPPVA